jgi:hypothetical protein
MLYKDTDPFMFQGSFGGLLTRLGTSEITNVHADGSVCATVALTRGLNQVPVPQGSTVNVPQPFGVST